MSLPAHTSAGREPAPTRRTLVAAGPRVRDDAGGVIADGGPPGLQLFEVPLGDLLVARAAFSYAGTRTPEHSVLPGDDDPRAVHVLAVAHGGIVGAATLTWDPFVLPSGERVLWRLRALGVATTAQRRGVGRALVEHRLRLAAQRGADAAWCSARDQNVELFTRWGAVAMGPLAVAGTQAPSGMSHTLMRWDVRRCLPPTTAPAGSGTGR